MMDTMERDPKHIAHIVRSLRKMRSFTQENLADASNLSTRTIEKSNAVVALTDEDIDRAIQCMLAFLPLPDEVAEPIFAPYLNGLALIAKSDLFFNFDSLARIQFVHSLAAALRHYGGWSGKAEEFEASFHVNFKEFVLDAENREKLLKALKAQGDPEETPLANLRSAKQIVDLFLLRIASHTWADILKRPVSED